ncbi:O-acyltransferase [Fasciolopsis buskii]|uniref:O-acyltransferase n=1 Tax=Fasciolopsis buskii TaxID=27845 RepID=A0A8E0S4G9_9TREM|nr:O-acyltransferase [Fasciolopsis buski]
MHSLKSRTVRAWSFGNVSDYEQLEKFYHENSPDKPRRSLGHLIHHVALLFYLCSIHRPNQSLLTTTSGFTNFRGLLNWGAFLLLITTGRMALENVLK